MYTIHTHFEKFCATGNFYGSNRQGPKAIAKIAYIFLGVAS